MLKARLIDLEGVTVQEMAVPDRYPPTYLVRACAPKIAAMVEPEDPIMLSIKKIVYRLEGRDGGGTYIYRRETGPWG